MNGRVYDPTIGRFLSADPIIQTLALSQAINAFSYVMNMPLTLIDPSGYSWLSKLFHSIGNWFHSQIFRLVLSIIVAIALPYFGPAFFSSGLLGAVATGAIAGGIAAGNLKGVLYGALAAGVAYGISSAINTAKSFSYSMTHTLAATGEQLQQITVTAQYAAAVTHSAAAAIGGVGGAVAGAVVAAEPASTPVRNPYDLTPAGGIPPGSRSISFSAGPGAPGFLNSVTFEEFEEIEEIQITAVSFPVGISGAARALEGLSATRVGYWLNRGQNFRMGVSGKFGNNVYRVAGDVLGKIPSSVREFFGIRFVGGQWKWDLWDMGPK